MTLLRFRNGFSLALAFLAVAAVASAAQAPSDLHDTSAASVTSYALTQQMPIDPDVHVHRVGRTGRAGAKGVALSLCAPRERDRAARLSGRIRWAKLPALYWVIGAGSGKPQSQAGPRRIAFDANWWITTAASSADAITKIATSSPS